MIPLVSVIVPVYNVEKYIGRCAESLMKQTLQNMEFIFVDDCSPDESIEALKQVIQRYPNRAHQVKIVRHDRNQGLPFARRSGIKAAEGEYVAHCDSDDWVDTGIYQKLYDKAKSSNADFVFCDFFSSDGNTSVARIQNRRDILDKESLIKHFADVSFHPSLCRVVVKRSVYEDPRIIFPANSMIEDKTLLLQLLYYSEGDIAWLHEPLYYVFFNPNSITRSNDEESILKKYNDIIQNNKILIPFLESSGLSVAESAILNLKLYAKNQLARLTGQGKYYRLWRETFPEINGKILLNSTIPSNKRLRYFLTWVHLFPVLIKIKDAVK